MKKIFIIILVCSVVAYVHGQDNLNNLVDKGIELHDQGKYKEAIDIYTQALSLDSESPLANYEIAMSYFYVKDYENALKYSSKVIEKNEGPLLDAYNIMAASLDHLGRMKESIEVYQEAVKLFDDNYLLYYNLGLNYYKINDYENATTAFINAIKNNPEHASSHMLLGFTMQEAGKRVQSLLCWYYFLFLEPDTERSHTVFTEMLKQFAANVKQDAGNSQNINILVAPDKGDEFSAADLMISLAQASGQLAENKNKTDFERFEENTRSLFLTLGELSKEENSGLWWESYVPFFCNIAQSEHFETYCRYVSQLGMLASLEWLQENESRLNRFSEWLETEEAIK